MRLTVQGRYTDFGQLSLALNVRFGPEADIRKMDRTKRKTASWRFLQNQFLIRRRWRVGDSHTTAVAFL
jgi:hypothetical protein